MVRVWLALVVLTTACHFYREDAAGEHDATPVGRACTQRWDCEQDERCVDGYCEPFCGDAAEVCENDTGDPIECCGPTEKCCWVGFEEACFPAEEPCPPNGGWGCNPLSQTGCQVGEKCAMVVDDPVSGAGHVSCVPDGVLAVGEACAEPTVPGTVDDCVAGTHCFLDVCRKICATVNDQCPDGVCVTLWDGNENPLPVEICAESCDLLQQDCADAGVGCYLARGPACLPAGTVQLGDSCDTYNDCEPGLVCLGTDSGGFVCRSLCGPWPECIDGDGVVASCGCGATVACGTDEICFAIGDGMGGVASESAGTCVPAAEVDYCDCDAEPICEWP